MAQPIAGLPANRLLSLDVFRGITIAGMILVNNPGTWSHVYPPLSHAAWHGWTPTDFIFPFFLFIVGVSMSFSFEKRLQAGMKPSAMYPKVFRRTLILFGLGLFLHLVPYDAPEGYNWFSDTLAKVRIMGVLQRIAVVYLCASLILLHWQRKGQIYWAIGLLAFYWGTMKLIPVSVPGVGVTVGSLAEEINVAAWLDNLVLRDHTYRVGTYFHHDPEGILSTLPAIVTALAGVFTGYWLKSGKPEYEVTSGMFFVGAICLIVGNIMAIWFPINKPLWSPSYVVFMTGMALLFLAACYYLIDIKEQVGWAKPFIIFGTNAIALYVLAEFATRITELIKVGDGISLKSWLYDTLFGSWLVPLNASLAFALVYVTFWLGMMTILYRQRIFIKV